MGKRKTNKQVIVDYFSLIVRTKSSTKSVRFESRGLPACRRKVCIFGDRTSSNVQNHCVLEGVILGKKNSLRQNCVLVLFDKLLSDNFSGEWIVKREYRRRFSLGEISTRMDPYVSSLSSTRLQRVAYRVCCCTSSETAQFLLGFWN